ncbi:MAG: hypothetical protein A3F09_02095 [Chlamydiae bacterium RIFCSPHIGHO2_12_FULL_49_11]|nr:MAG: hypothetical protein A3F09_02095 [Chlamydiae bacterium RIFCSPHIGHO2_12_FULL_49_11]
MPRIITVLVLFASCFVLASAPVKPLCQYVWLPEKEIKCPTRLQPPSLSTELSTETLAFALFPLDYPKHDVPGKNPEPLSQTALVQTVAVCSSQSRVTMLAGDVDLPLHDSAAFAHIFALRVAEPACETDTVALIERGYLKLVEPPPLTVRPLRQPVLPQSFCQCASIPSLLPRVEATLLSFSSSNAFIGTLSYESDFPPVSSQSHVARIPLSRNCHIEKVAFAFALPRYSVSLEHVTSAPIAASIPLPESGSVHPRFEAVSSSISLPSLHFVPPQKEMEIFAADSFLLQELEKAKESVPLSSLSKKSIHVIQNTTPCPKKVPPPGPDVKTAIQVSVYCSNYAVKIAPVSCYPGFSFSDLTLLCSLPGHVPHPILQPEMTRFVSAAAIPAVSARADTAPYCSTISIGKRNPESTIPSFPLGPALFTPYFDFSSESPFQIVSLTQEHPFPILNRNITSMIAVTLPGKALPPAAFHTMEASTESSTFSLPIPRISLESFYLTSFAPIEFGAEKIPLSKKPSLFLSFNTLHESKKVNLAVRQAHENVSFISELLTLYNKNIEHDFVCDLKTSKDPLGEDVYFLLNIKPKPKLEYLPLPGKIVYMLDSSIAIEEKKFDTYKKAILRSIAHLSPNMAFNIITFDNGHAAFSKEFEAATPDNLEKARLFLAKCNRSSRSSSKTLFELIAYFQNRSKEKKEITNLLLFSDGKNCGNVVMERDKLVTFAKGIHPRFTVHAFALAENNNRLMLELLSRLSHGFMIEGNHRRLVRKVLALTTRLKHPILEQVLVSSIDKTDLVMHNAFLSNPLYNAGFSVYGKAKNSRELSLFIQGYAGQNWVAMPKRFNIQTKETNAGLERKVRYLIALEEITNYLLRGDESALSRGKTLMEALGIDIIAKN